MERMQILRNFPEQSPNGRLCRLGADLPKPEELGLF